MKKIDVHIHASLHRREHQPNPFNPEDCYFAEAQELVEHLNSQGIGQAILMSGGPSNPEAGNEACRQMAEKFPGVLSWMCNIDGETDPAQIQTILSDCKAKGAKGVGELAVNEWMDSPRLSALFAAAEELGLPVTIHMSPEPGFNYGVCDKPGLPLLEKTLQQHPKLKILGHSQPFWLEISGDCPREGNEARNGVGRGPVTPGGRVPALFDAYPNLYGDLSAFSASCAILRDEEFGLQFLEKYQDRLLYATDTVNRHQVFPLGKFLDEAVESGRLSQEAYRKICWENAQRLFSL